MVNNYSSHEFKRSDKKPERYTQDGFTKVLIGKVAKITLINGTVLQGRLIEIGMFDAQIQTSQTRLIVMKSAIQTVEVIQ